jgi:ketosteroid isomerase-like protein
MKPRSFNLLSAIAVALLMIACTNKSVETESAKAESVAAFDLEKAKTAIRELDDKFSADVKRGDSLAVASHYGADALAMPPNGEPVSKDGLSSMWGEAIRMGVKDLKLEITEVNGNEHLLAETGKYEMYGENNKILDKGKYVVVWKQENGAWKIYRDIWNTSMPPPPAK